MMTTSSSDVVYRLRARIVKVRIAAAANAAIVSGYGRIRHLRRVIERQGLSDGLKRVAHDRQRDGESGEDERDRGEHGPADATDGLIADEGCRTAIRSRCT